MTDQFLFKTKTEFSLHIESLAKEHDCSYIDACLYFAEITGADYSDLALMMSASLIEKIRIEAQSLFHLPKSTTTPIDECCEISEEDDD